jgi:hypothetical protein
MRGPLTNAYRYAWKGSVEAGRQPGRPELHAGGRSVAEDGLVMSSRPGARRRVVGTMRRGRGDEPRRSL